MKSHLLALTMLFILGGLNINAQEQKMKPDESRNSGSAVINKEAEIVGLAFDGNIESLPSNFIFTTEVNRTVCVSALGMMEAIQDLYKATRLSNELSKGKAE